MTTRPVFGLATTVALATTVLTAFADQPCSAANFMTGCAAATTRDFRGAIIVPGSDAANAAVARNGGCEGCDWTLVVDCDHLDSPRNNVCNAARCPDGTVYRVYLQRPTDENPTYVDSVCLTPTRRIVTANDLAVDVERYLTNLTPPTTTIAVQPDGRAVTNLATYFRATGPQADDATLNVTTAAGPATLTIHIAASRYVWQFGDGTTCETEAPGLPYDGGEPGERCDDHVAHVYAEQADATVGLAATWRGTYSFDVGFGPVGPLPIPGNGVTAPRQTRTVQVRDATAQLVGD